MFVKKDHADLGHRDVSKIAKDEFNQEEREEDFQKNTGDVKINHFGVIFEDDSINSC